MCVKEYSEVKNMKESIQPKYHDNVIQSTCGEKFGCGTTKDVDVIKVDVCNKCHPFYTGKQKLVDTGGRVDKFKKRYSL